MEVKPCLNRQFILLALLFTVIIQNSHFISASTKDDEDSFRLPGFVTPTHYDLTLLPILEGNPKLCGYVWINVTAQEDSQFIVLNAAYILPIEVFVYSSESQMTDSLDPFQRVEDVCFSFNENDASPQQKHDDDLVQGIHVEDQSEHIVIVLKEPLEVGASYRVGVLYKAEIYDSDNIGFFRVEHRVNGSECCKRWIGATQLEATHARKMFPCLDEPGYKATFDVTIGHSSKLTAVSNMPLKLKRPLESVEEWVWDTFETSPPMSPYLVACVLSELEYLETSYQSISGRIVSLRLWTERRNFNLLELSYDLIPKIMMALESYLAIPYALPKLDIIAFPGYSVTRAMENWGLVIQSESNFFVDNELTSNLEKTTTALTIVHELAHQWFGNLVTSSWWDDIWLNEGLSTLFENIVLNQVAPELQADTVVVLFTQQAFTYDKIGSSLPLNFPVELLPSVDHKFDGFAYAKASAVFRMIRSFIGDDTFKSALQRYFQQFQFKTANSTDLWNLINQEARRRYSISSRMSIARIMKTWTDKAGYPVVYVQRNSNGTIQLTQSPYVDPDFPIDDKLKEPYLWWVPVSMTSGSAPSFTLNDRLPKIWLTPKRPSVTIDGPNNSAIWVLVNLEYSGYYRVNYDEIGWKLLAHQLLMNHTTIPPLNRAQLIDDAFVLLKSNLTSYEVAMNLIEYLGKVEEEDYIRSVAIGHVNRIEQELILQLAEKENADLFKIVGKMKTFVYPSISNISRTDRLISEGSDVGCLQDGLACTNISLNLFRDEMQGRITPPKKKQMEKHLESIWCSAIKYGARKEWKYAWAESLMSSIETIGKNRRLKALTCTTDLVQAKQLLNRVFHPNTAQQPYETLIILENMAKNPSTRHLALRFVITKWNFLTKHTRNASRMRNILVSLTQSTAFVDEMNLSKVNAFLEENSKELGPEISDLIAARMKTNPILRARINLKTPPHDLLSKSPNFV